MFAIDAGFKSAGKTGLRWAPEVSWAGTWEEGEVLSSPVAAAKSNSTPTSKFEILSNRLWK